ncbi:hypothetical protein [Clostridium sp. LIBA-8841]|uniref:hypothetical protein n=1 Tax=Clostridium sp. LIBA-8841 TaxID=2987530 RepID=UPI002AC7D924|nr:hypothetical protein [Clostridium sp. LIBA-8841]MDZ5253652.1 hypothetical protein [Clostridium sp. LIBA-8841]
MMGSENDFDLCKQYIMSLHYTPKDFKVKYFEEMSIVNRKTYKRDKEKGFYENKKSFAE